MILVFAWLTSVQFSSVAQLCRTFCNPWTAARQAPYPLPAPGVCLNSCPSSWWCHPTISSSAVPFSSRLQSCPTSGSFPMSWFFVSGGQSIGVSASASVLPMNIQSLQGLFQWVDSSYQEAKVLEFQLQHQSFQWIFRIDFLEDWLVWSPCSPRDSQESSPTPQLNSISSSALSLLYSPTLNIHTWLLEKP